MESCSYEEKSKDNLNNASLEKKIEIEEKEEPKIEPELQEEPKEQNQLISADKTECNNIIIYILFHHFLFYKIK